MFYIKVLSSLCLFLQVMHMLITCRSPGRRLSLSLSNANHTGLYIYIYLFIFQIDDVLNASFLLSPSLSHGPLLNQWIV